MHRVNRHFEKCACFKNDVLIDTDNRIVTVHDVTNRSNKFDKEGNTMKIADRLHRQTHDA